MREQQLLAALGQWLLAQLPQYGVSGYEVRVAGSGYTYGLHLLEGERWAGAIALRLGEDRLELTSLPVGSRQWQCPLCEPQLQSRLLQWVLDKHYRRRPHG